MNSPLVAGFLLIVVLCAVSAHPGDIFNNFRTYPYQKPDCRPGLCPAPRRLVPEGLGPRPPVYGYNSRSYSDDYGEPSLCGNLCTSDNECSEHQKCCPTTCGYACQGIVFISE